jgi:hypothetical protein
MDTRQGGEDGGGIIKQTLGFSEAAWRFVGIAQERQPHEGTAALFRLGVYDQAGAIVAPYVLVALALLGIDRLVVCLVRWSPALGGHLDPLPTISSHPLSIERVHLLHRLGGFQHDRDVLSPMDCVATEQAPRGQRDVYGQVWRELSDQQPRVLPPG